MSSSSTTSATAVVLVDLAEMIAVGGALAGIAARWRQPAVIGEIIAGIVLGPTLLGMLPGHLTTRLFPIADRPFLSVLASVGLVLFMFGVGFELHPGRIRKTASSAALVSLVSVAVPFGLGAVVALLLYHMDRSTFSNHVSLLPFVLFIGVAMSITAFPVLARILTGLRLQQNRIGAFTMTSAAGTDVLAWGLLAFVAAIAAGGSKIHVLWLAVQMLAYIAILAFVVRPILDKVLRSSFVRRRQDITPLLIVVVGLLLSAWVTTRLGFQPIFGGFIFGVLVPREAIQEAAPQVPALIEQASWLLVPVFFTVTGLGVNLAGLGAKGYAEAALVLVAACVGKFSGTASMARLRGFDGRRAVAVGVLMNCRGLTELVVIQVGVSLGILTRQLASIMIIMAVLTTIATTPVFRWLYSDRMQEDDAEAEAEAEAEAAELEEAGNAA